jgi:hypothetical protein
VTSTFRSRSSMSSAITDKLISSAYWIILAQEICSSRSNVAISYNSGLIHEPCQECHMSHFLTQRDKYESSHQILEFQHIAAYLLNKCRKTLVYLQNTQSYLDFLITCGTYCLFKIFFDNFCKILYTENVAMFLKLIYNI